MQVKIALFPREDITGGLQNHQFTDITKSVSKKRFPSKFSQSLKGEAFFDFTVKGFAFSIIKTEFNDILGTRALSTETDSQLKMRRYDAVLIMDKDNNEVVSRGFVDGIEDWNDSEPKIKYMPDATRLKDIKAGVITSDEDDDDEIWEFEIAQTTQIDDIVSQLIDQANTTIGSGDNKSPKAFYASGLTVPPPSGDNGLQTGENRFLGTVLHKMKKTGLSFNLAKMFIDMFDSSYLRRKVNSGEPSGYDWHYEVQDAGVIKRILISKGQWLSINLGQWMSWSFRIPNGLHFSALTIGIPYPNGITFNSYGTIFGWSIIKPWTIAIAWTTYDIHLGNILPTLEYDSITWHIPNDSINVPSSHLYIPCIGSRHDLYYLAGGDMQHSQSYVKSIFPIVDSNFHVADTDGDEEGGDVQISNLDGYGTRWDNNGSSANISHAKMSAYVKDEGSSIMAYRTAMDWDENNTYTILKTKKAWNDIGGSEWLVGFETPFDFYQRVHYKNATPAKILRDICVVTNRLLYIDNDNKVWLKERDLTMDGEYSQLNVDRKWFISRKVKIKRDIETDIKLDRYKKDSEGKVQSYGIVLRESEWEFLQSYYKDKFSGDIITNTIEILKASEIDEAGGTMPHLLDLVFMNDLGSLTKLGIVIQEDIALEHSKYKYVTQFNSLTTESA